MSGRSFLNLDGSRVIDEITLKPGPTLLKFMVSDFPTMKFKSERDCHQCDSVFLRYSYLVVRDPSSKLMVAVTPLAVLS